MNFPHDPRYTLGSLVVARSEYSASKRVYELKHNKWREAEKQAVAYMPEREVDAIRRNKREEGSPQYTTIYVPYTYGILMASHTYWTTVFMSRNPVLQFAGRHGEAEQQVQALEALIDYQVQNGNALVPWYVWLYDVGKYGVGITGLYWDEEFSIISTIEEREELFMGLLKTGRTKKVKLSRRVKGYEGNKLYNVRPYDFFPDPRVTLANFQTGEFCAVFREIGYNTILRRASQGYYINTDQLIPAKGVNAVTQEELGSTPHQEKPDTRITFLDKGTVDNKKTKGNASISAYEVYVELIPSDWGLGSGSLPEKWVFTITSDFRVVFGAQPLGANHDKFPFNVLVLEPDGYSILPRGMPEILQPVQDTINWLVNSHFYNVRRILNGRYVIDPSRVVMSDMLDLSQNIIRMKPAGYGTNPAEAVQQLQAVDVTQGHIQDMQTMLDIGQRAVGVNDQLMGVMQSTGRRATATEARTSAGFGINRLKTCSEFFSATGWSPMSTMMVQNTQQYYDGEKKFKIVGDLAQDAGSAFMQVTPDDITGFYDFVTVDGTLPIDRYAQSNLWTQLLGQMRTYPQIMQQYDVGRIFAWIAQISGLKNINQFKIKVAPPGMDLGAQATAGNVVPWRRRMLT